MNKEEHGSGTPGAPKTAPTDQPTHNTDTDTPTRQKEHGAAPRADEPGTPKTGGAPGGAPGGKE